MKFAAALQRCAEYSEPIHDLHATYRAAKKLINSHCRHELAVLLKQVVASWSDYYLDAEEDLVIECAELQSACAQQGSSSRSDQCALLGALVDFHGR